MVKSDYQLVEWLDYVDVPTGEIHESPRATPLNIAFTWPALMACGEGGDILHYALWVPHKGATHVKQFKSKSSGHLASIGLWEYVERYILWMKINQWDRYKDGLDQCEDESSMQKHSQVTPHNWIVLDKVDSFFNIHIHAVIKNVVLMRKYCGCGVYW